MVTMVGAMVILGELVEAGVHIYLNKQVGCFLIFQIKEVVFLSLQVVVEG